MTPARLGDWGMVLVALAAFLFDPFLLAINIAAGVIGTIILRGFFAIIDRVDKRTTTNNRPRRTKESSYVTGT